MAKGPDGVFCVTFKKRERDKGENTATATAQNDFHPAAVSFIPHINNLPRAKKIYGQLNYMEHCYF